MICFPNAKINLGLNILSKRKDNMHNIKSCIIPVPLTDILEIRLSSVFKMTLLGDIEGIDIVNNTITSTWKILNDIFKTLQPIEVVLFKKIPTGSGLGGGSSDAAFFLKLVNGYLKLGIASNDMVNIISEVGADCPFFIENTTAIVSETGSLIEPVKNPLENMYISIICYDIKISTREMFELVIPRSETPLPAILDDLSQWKELLKNDFEEPVFNKYSFLYDIKEELYRLGALYVSLSGTGSSVFAVSAEKLILSEKLIKHFHYQFRF